LQGRFSTGQNRADQFAKFSVHLRLLLCISEALILLTRFQYPGTLADLLVCSEYPLSIGTPKETNKPRLMIVHIKISALAINISEGCLVESAIIVDNLGWCY